MRNKIFTIVIFVFVAAFKSEACYERRLLYPNQKFDVRSPKFPAYYPPGYTCKWDFTTVNEAYLTLHCTVVYFTGDDYLLVSKVGDLRNATKYRQHFSVEGTAISMQLISTYSSGGKFKCEIRSQIRRTSTCECGKMYCPRLYGGYPTGINQFPSAVALVEKNTFHTRCGGTIIGRRIVLTAAHCLTTMQPFDLNVLIGGHSIKHMNVTNAAKLLNIEAFIMHEKYTHKHNSNLYDIAIVITKEVIKCSERVGPAYLPSREINLNRKDLIIVGWGYISREKQSDVLRRITVKGTSDTVCKSIFRKYYNRVQHLCSFRPGKDACDRDSGGPVYYKHPRTKRLILVGIVSFGYFNTSCESSRPSVNVKVSYFLDWMKQQLPSGDFCFHQ